MHQIFTICLPGLCGVWDGDGSNDYTTIDGIISGETGLYADIFAASWRSVGAFLIVGIGALCGS